MHTGPARQDPGIHSAQAWLQLELERKALEPLSEEHAERRRQEAARKAQGTLAMQESIDAVKHMTQLATAAQCAAVRYALSHVPSPSQCCT